jgi:hypothetical protein
MAQTAVVRRFSYDELLPLIDLEVAFKSATVVNLPPSSTITKGTLLLPPNFAGTSAVQTITPPGSLTYTLSGVNPLTNFAWTTAALAFGANDATVQAAIDAVINGPGNTYSSGAGVAPALVTVAALAVTFGGSLANYPVPLMTIATAGSGSPGVANTTPGVMPGTAPVYAGSGTPAFIMRYSLITDNAGNITFGAQAGGIESGAIDVNANVYTKGTFDASLLVGLDANAVTKRAMTFLRGSLTAGPGSTPAGTIYIP